MNQATNEARAEALAAEIVVGALDALAANRTKTGADRVAEGLADWRRRLDAARTAGDEDRVDEVLGDLDPLSVEPSRTASVLLAYGGPTTWVDIETDGGGVVVGAKVRTTADANGGPSSTWSSVDLDPETADALAEAVGVS